MPDTYWVGMEDDDATGHVQSHKLEEDECVWTCEGCKKSYVRLKKEKKMPCPNCGNRTFEGLMQP